MRDATIGLGFAAALTILAFVTGEPVQAQEIVALSPANLQEESRQLIGDLITDRTGTLCVAPVVFDYGADWVAICQNDSTVWTLAASGDLYQNGDMKTAIERNFR